MDFITPKKVTPPKKYVNMTNPSALIANTKKSVAKAKAPAKKPASNTLGQAGLNAYKYKGTGTRQTYTTSPVRPKTTPAPGYVSPIPKVTPGQAATPVYTPPVDTGMMGSEIGMSTDVAPIDYSTMLDDGSMQGSIAMDLLTQFMESNGYAPTPEEMAEIRAQALAEAKKKNDILRGQIDSQLKTATDSYNSGRDQINTNLADARESLEDQSFQQYLQSRQEMANRGLATSGLAEGENTRLLLGRDRSMAGIYRDVDNDLNELTREFNTQKSTLENQRSQINDETTSEEIYNQLMEENKKTKAEQEERYLKFIDTLMPYIQPTANNILDNQTSRENNILNNTTKSAIAKLNNDTKLQINNDNIAASLQTTSMNIQAKMAQLDNTRWNQSQQQMISIAKSKYSQAAQILKAMEGMDPKSKSFKNAQASYDATVKEANLTMGMAQSQVSSSGFNGAGGGGGFNYSKYKVTSEFGNRRDPITGKSAFHSGIDIGMKLNDPVGATRGGTVVYAGFGQPGSGYGGFGNVVVVKDAQGLLHQYNHLNKINVKVGQQVGAGAILGGAGSTGRSTGVHLDYMVKQNGKAINPRPYILG